MAGYYDPYEQYWQGVPQRGNVKQPTGLAVLLNAVLGNAIPGYQQGMQQTNIAQEQALREQQRQTNVLQMQKLQEELNWDPIMKQVALSKEFGADWTPSTQQRDFLTTRGLQVPEGAMTPMTEQKLLAQIQMHDSKIAQLDRFLEHKKVVSDQLNAHLERLDEVRGRGVDVAEERNRILSQANAIRQEIGQAETMRKSLLDKANSLKMSAKDYMSTDKFVASLLQKRAQKIPWTPEEQQAFIDATKYKSAGAIYAGDIRRQEGEAERIKSAKDNYAKEVQSIDLTLKELEAIALPNTPMYKNIQAQKAKRKREVYERYKMQYPEIQFPEPVGARSAITQSGEGVTK